MFIVVSKLASIVWLSPISSGFRVVAAVVGCISVPCSGLWLGCSDGDANEPGQEVVSKGIPAGEFDAFAHLVRSIDEAQSDLDAAQTVGNPATIREKGILLAQQQQLMTQLYVDQHGQATITRWIATVRAASNSASSKAARPATMQELQVTFTELGAKIQSDENGRITGLDCGKIVLPADAVKHLHRFKYLRTLNLSSTDIKDEDLAQIKSLKLIRVLDLGRNKFDGSGLINLKDLENLEHLKLNDTGLTDAAIPQLKELDHLKKITVLNLEGTALTTQGYEKITRLFRRANVLF